VLTFFSFIFVLGILIFVHELGHFLVAKKLGIKVERFSLGFPPNIISRQFGDTIYSIGIIPLGGYVKMAGEHPDEESTGAPNEFMSRPVSHRAAVLVAGPLMNYFLAIAIMTGIYLFAGIPYSDPDRIVVGEVAAESPAAQAGLISDDNIIAVNGQPVRAFDSMRTVINSFVEAPVGLTWVRHQDTLSASIVTRKAEVMNAEGNVDTVGEIGISEKIAGYKKYALGPAFVNGFSKTHVILWETLVFLKQLVTGQISTKLIGGPVFIAQQSGEYARRGPSWLFFFVALLSVNLAVLNIQPVIPVLDGGQLLFLMIEKMRGRPLPLKARIAVQYVGILAVLTLTLFVTYNDILRLLGRL
jgi:regulator of sigma E protease